MTVREHHPFVPALIAERRSTEIPDSADAYGWLIGSWEMDVLRYWAVDVSAQQIKIEAHFVWVLEGRVLQDVWIMPPRGARPAVVDKERNMYGTTLRAWDPTIEAWRITWINPAGSHYEQQIGRRVGDDIVQLGVRPDGTVTRWRFTDTTDDSFRWIGESLQPDGVSWTLEGDFLARRLR